MRLILLLLTIPGFIFAKTLEVGPGKKYQRIEAAVGKAKKGDTIKVYPLKNNEAYSKVAVYFRTGGLTIIGMGKEPVKLSGKGYEYSGVGSVPRAMFQFNKGTDGCVVENFDLSGASNKSHNGAAIRISQANDIRISKCVIHGNDMGVMSNGDGSAKLAQNQIIEFCHVHSNGNMQEPGYNHNFYLGGASATIRFCEVNNSLTGHNVKSRAHFNRIEYSYIHDSANREFDLVDGKDTTVAGSHSVLIGNLIVKDSKCKGNRGTIHFGQDGGKAHNGDLYLIHNTIISPFISTIVQIDHAQAGLKAHGNIFHDNFSNQNNMNLLSLVKGAKEAAVSGSYNYFSKGFKKLPASFKSSKIGSRLKFKDQLKLDYRLSTRMTSSYKMNIPDGPGMKSDKVIWQYKHPMQKVKRPKQSSMSLGAFD
jgi:hypothetical protein